MIKKYICFDVQTKIQIRELRQSLESEPFHDLNKQEAISLTQCFDNQIPQFIRIKKALLNIIYLINQGTYFADEEKEMLFCKITKLFQHSDPSLKRLNYKVISLIISESFDCIIVQSLLKDLISNYQLIRQVALSSLKYLRSLRNQIQLVRFLQKAINDQKSDALNRAIITGLNLFAKHPNLIKSCTTQLEDNIFQNSPISNYHAFVLISEIKKSQDQRFNQFLQRLIKLKLKTLINMQVIRFVQDALQIADVYDEKIYIDYLLLQIQDKDPIIVIEASKVLGGLNKIDNYTIKPVVTKLFYYLSSKFHYIKIFSSLKILIKIFTNPIRQELLTKQMMYILEANVFQYRSQISSQALYLCVYLQENKQKISIILKNIYSISKLITFHLNFFNGLLEFYIENPKYGEAVLNFLYLIFGKNYSVQLINEAIKLVIQIFFNSIESRISAISSLIWLAKLSDKTNKFKVIVVLNQFVNNKFYDQIETNRISQLYQDIKSQIQSYSSIDYEDEQLSAINLRVELFKKNQSVNEYIEKMKYVIQQ